MTIPVTRRGLLGLTAGTLGALAVNRTRALAVPGRPFVGKHLLAQDSLAGPFVLPELEYPDDALEPHIDAMTMEIHHTKHHQTYIDNLNKVISEHPEIQDLEPYAVLADLTLIPEAIRPAVRNNLGGDINHTLFWQFMTPLSTEPSQILLDAIKRDFGSLEEMQAAVTDAGLKRFGSGWTWVVSDEGRLSVMSTPNQDNPVMEGPGTPIIGIDVWEHAYYLKYQNKRADYLAAWWNVANWQMIDTLYEWSMTP